MKTIDKCTVELINMMGSDLSVVNAARVSFDKESDWEIYYNSDEDSGHDLSNKDKKLISYLAKHNHWSPFAHCMMSFRISAPIFVARQLVKHQVGLSWNEVSRRYVDSEPVFFVPATWRRRAADKKQGSSIEAVEDEAIDNGYEMALKCSVGLYNAMLRAEVCPEQARMVLPQSMMTTWIWTGSLYAFARVCNLRCTLDTQVETREVAHLIHNEAKKLFPVSWEALIKE